jgi:hypothetical protein
MVIKIHCLLTLQHHALLWVLQVIQLYEMIVVRHGLMLVGWPFSGKTASYRILAAALNIMHARREDEQESATYHVVNPKAVTIGQLYGQVGLTSQRRKAQWAIARKRNRTSKSETKELQVVE